MSVRKRGGAAAQVTREEEEGEEEEEEEEEEEQTQRKRKAPSRQRQSTRAQEASTSRRGGAGEEEEEEEEEEQQESYFPGDSDDDEPASKRRTGGDKGKQKRRARSLGGGGGSQVFFSQSTIETNGQAFTQAPDEAFLAEASQETLRPQDEKHLENLSGDQKKALLADTVRYILMKGSQKEAIKRSKLHEDVLKAHNVAKGVVKPIIKEAREYLEKTFGYQLVQVPDTKFPGTAMQESYFLITGLRMPGLSQELNTYGKDVGLRGLIMVVLSLLFCAGSKIDEQALFKQLSDVDKHICFDTKGRGRDAEYIIGGDLDGVGLVHDALEMMKKELYILREKGDLSDDGNQAYVYKLGPRAFVEVGRLQLVHFIAETMGQSVDPAVVADLQNEDEMQRKVADARG